MAKALERLRGAAPLIVAKRVWSGRVDTKALFVITCPALVVMIGGLEMTSCGGRMPKSDLDSI
ncbi:hypothetical protein [Rhizobium mesoamericanum]|uniref:hypothetical protein n=1 Tax=Rhizobium mesoamericanum TaxID=1079800 RepID=UPI00041148CE|nr:hypothetical protein [Rhizobium mesoamericanum]